MAEEGPPTGCIDPRNDDWARGASESLNSQDDAGGLLFVGLVGAAVLAPLIYAAWVTRATAVIAAAAILALLFAAAAVLFLLDARDRSRLSEGRRVGARVASVDVSTAGGGLKGRVRVGMTVTVEFVSPVSGRMLQATIAGNPGDLRKPEVGDQAWVAYLDDEHFEVA